MIAVCDPSLALGPAVSTILATWLDMAIRLRRSKEELNVCAICKRWFPATHMDRIHEFLTTPRLRLDVGVGHNCTN